MYLSTLALKEYSDLKERKGSLPMNFELTLLSDII